MDLLAQNSWPKAIAWTRAALAAISIALSYLLLPPAAVLYQALLGVFLVYAILAAMRAKPHSGLLGLLALFADAVYFLVLAGRADSLIWFSSLLFLYLLVEAVALYSAMEVLMIASSAAIFCAVLPLPQLRELERTVLISGVLACAWAVNRRRQAVEIDRLSESLRDRKSVV